MPRPGAGGDEDVPALLDGLEHLLLVQPHGGVADQARHDRVEQAPVGHRLHRLALGERLGEGDERPLDQRDVERRGAFQERAGLLRQLGVRQRERREDVAQELVADLVGEVDGVDRHHGYSPTLRGSMVATSSRRRIRRFSSARTSGSSTLDGDVSRMRDDASRCRSTPARSSSAIDDVVWLLRARLRKPGMSSSRWSAVAMRSR